MTLISTLSQPCTGHRDHRIKPLLAKMNKKTWLAVMVVCSESGVTKCLCSVGTEHLNLWSIHFPRS